MSDSEPEITLMVAEPDSQESNDYNSNSEEEKMSEKRRKPQRLSTFGVSPDMKNIPAGMRPSNSTARYNDHLDKEKTKTSPKTSTTNIILIAFGIGLGILLVSKGYKYIKPVFGKVAEESADKIVEEIVETIN